MSIGTIVQKFFGLIKNRLYAFPPPPDFVQDRDRQNRRKSHTIPYCYDNVS